MSWRNRLRLIGALAPALGIAVSGSLAFGGHGRQPSPCPPCPCPTGQPSAVVVPDLSISPAPEVTEGEVVDGEVSDGATAVAPSPTSLPTPVAIDAPTTASQVDPGALFASNFGRGGASSLAFADLPTNGGYVDTAVVSNQLRVRFDSMWGINRPDRAEFMYSTWRAFGGKNPNPPEGFPDPRVDRNTLWLYYEHAFCDDDVSVFVDVPLVSSNPLRNPEDQGFGDIIVGLKLSLYETCQKQVTFQLKNYLPTAKSSELWLGTGHYSIEPGLLFLSRLNKRLTLETEIRDWIPIGGAVNPLNNKDYAGNVLRYGAALGYDIGCCCTTKVTPVAEVVGWSVLGGQVFDFDGLTPNPPPVSASGDTIVNMKLGTRFSNKRGGSMYIGWGRSLTGDRWYQDIARLELRKMF